MRTRKHVERGNVVGEWGGENRARAAKNKDECQQGEKKVRCAGVRFGAEAC